MPVRAKKPMVKWYGRLLYGAGGLGCGAAVFAATALLMFFGTAVQGIPATLVGVVGATGLFLSVIITPACGYLSDKTDSRLFGKRLGYTLSASFVAALFNALLWSIPESFPFWMKFIWMLLSGAALSLMLCFVWVPFRALIPELAGDEREKAGLKHYADAFVCAAALGMLLVFGLVGEKASSDAFRNIGYIGSILIIIGGCASFFGVYSHLPRLRAKSGQTVPEEEHHTAAGVIADYFRLLKLRNYRAVLLGSAFAFGVPGIFAGLGVHFLRFSLDLSFAAAAGFIAIAAGAAILAQTFWSRSGKSRRAPAVTGMIFAVVGLAYLTLIFVLYRYTDTIGFAPFAETIPAAIFVGVGLSASFSVPRLMMRDLIERYRKIDGMMTPSMQYNLLSVSRRIIIAALVLALGAALDITAVLAASASGAPNAAASLSIGWIVTAGTLVMASLSAVLFSRFNADSKND